MLATIPESMTFRVVLIVPESRAILVRRNVDSYRLPCVQIHQGARPAQELRTAIRASWGLQVHFLELLFAPDGMSACAIAELLLPVKHPDFGEIQPCELLPNELSEEEASTLRLILSGEGDGFISQLGWLDDVCVWLESTTGDELRSKVDFEQLNAGRGNALVLLPATSGRRYWLKAVGRENVHEFAVTRMLSQLCGKYLPRLVDSRPDWNAWLTAGDAAAPERLPSETLAIFEFLEVAVESMAELQLRTVGKTGELLAAGAFDHRSDSLVSHMDAICECVEEAMSQQASTRVPRLGVSRLREIREIVAQVCSMVHDLKIPDTVLHGDLNPANILIGPGHCQFIDWREAYVGNPLISFEHLLLFNQRMSPGQGEASARHLKDLYRAKLSRICDSQLIEKGFLYSPILAAYSALLGRGEWMRMPVRYDSRRHAYVRILARQIDVAAREPQLLESLGINAHT